MEISAEKTKLMTKSANGIQRQIKGQKPGTVHVTSFKCFRAVVSDDGSNQSLFQGLNKPLQLLQNGSILVSYHISWTICGTD